MAWQFTPMILLLVAAACTTYALALRAWRMRPARGAAAFALLMLCSGIWATSDALGAIGTSLTWKLILTRCAYLGIVGTIFAWSLFVIVYSHYERWLNRYVVGALAIVPAITYVLVLFIDQHTLFYRSIALAEMDGVVFLTSAYGPAFWLWAGYAYLVVLGGGIVLIQAIVRFPSLYRGQALTVTLGALVPMVSNILYVSGLTTMTLYDPSPIAFTVTGILVMLGMQRYHLLDIVPVAYDLVFKNVNAGVVIIDLQGRIMEMNPVAEHILGSARKKVLGETIFGLAPHRALLSRFREVTEVVTEIAMGAEGQTYELQIVPLTDRADRSAGRIIVFYDITERKRAMEERENLIKELDAYAHTVAHDLKNPLAAVIGYVDLVEQLAGDQLSEIVRQSLGVIGDQSRRMTAIVEELLTLASVRSVADIDIAPLDMDQIVDGALSRLSSLVDDAGAQIERPQAWPVALGYAPWVEEVWANYISNAVKYGGEPPRIELGADALAGGTVRLWTRDNGQGMSEHECATLFQRFSRLDRHQRIEGHGLGLSIVQRIVTKLGGEVGVESEVGSGSTFYFCLPADIRLP